MTVYLTVGFITVLFLATLYFILKYAKQKSITNRVKGKALQIGYKFLDKIFTPIDYFQSKWNSYSNWVPTCLLIARIDGQEFLFEISLSQYEVLIVNPTSTFKLKVRTIRPGQDEFYFEPILEKYHAKGRVTVEIG